MRAAGSATTTTHWPAFDGLRALAIIDVILFHYGFTRAVPGGYVGVDLFFVLSGFLITWLLLTETDRFSRVSYRLFYLRRALRLLPALALVIAFTIVISYADRHFAPLRHEVLFAPLWVIFFIGNWPIVFSNSLAKLGLLGVTWSLAVEEQFYLLWPATLSAALRRISRTRLAVVVLVLAVAQMVARGVLVHAGVSGFRWYYPTYTHSDGLLVGCAIALVWSRYAEWSARWQRWLSAYGFLLGWTGLAAIVLVSVFGDLQPMTMVWCIPIAVIGTGGLLVSVLAGSGRILRVALSWRPLVAIGKRSYGAYLWHDVIRIWVASWQLSGRHVLLERRVSEIGITTVVVALSYALVEHPVLRQKDRFARVLTTDRTRADGPVEVKAV